MLLRMLMKLDNLMIISSIIFLFIISCASVDYKNTDSSCILFKEKKIGTNQQRKVLINGMFQ